MLPKKKSSFGSPPREWGAVVLVAALLSCFACRRQPLESGPSSAEPGAPGAFRQLSEVCTPVAPDPCGNARDDNCNGIIDEGCGLSTGLVQFVIAWDKPGADVDLLVTDPGGELIEVGRISKSGMVKERDCPGRRNECRGRNLENVFLEPQKQIERGRFQVKVRLEKLGDEEPPVRVNLGVRLGQRTEDQALEFQRNEEEQTRVFDL